MLVDSDFGEISKRPAVGVSAEQEDDDDEEDDEEKEIRGITVANDEDDCAGRLLLLLLLLLILLTLRAFEDELENIVANAVSCALGTTIDVVDNDAAVGSCVGPFPPSNNDACTALS